MDYTALADELLSLRIGLLQVPANRKLSELVKGEPFVLNYLMMHQSGAFPSEISRQMVVSTARIAALLNHMEEKGLITRTADPQDNRHIIVSLTEAGAQEIREKRDEAIALTAKTLELLGPEDAREYLRIQAKLINKAREQM